MDRHTIDKLTALMAFPSIVGGPYSRQRFHVPKYNKVRNVGGGAIVKCCKCGSTYDTLYNCGDLKICKKCKQNDDKKKRDDNMSNRHNANEEKFEKVIVLGIPMLFSDNKIDRDTVPNNLFMYEVRHDDDSIGIPVQICDWVAVNHYGTLISKRPIEFDGVISNGQHYKDIEPEEIKLYGGGMRLMTLKEYISK